MISGLNHITYSVSDLNQSIKFYRDIMGGKLLVESERMAYFDLGGIWLALNEEKDIPRNDIQYSYTHTAFTIIGSEFEKWYEKLVENGVNILEGRKRDERDRKSLYFTDPDGHKLELHTGTLQDRIDYYKQDKKHMIFYDL